MPHQCTNCGRTFDDGSKEMLSGCPDCGGNKFQFQPAGSDHPSAFDEDSAATDAPENLPEPDRPDRGRFTDAAARAGAAVRDRLSSDPPEADGPSVSNGAPNKPKSRDSPASETSTTDWPDPTDSGGERQSTEVDADSTAVDSDSLEADADAVGGGADAAGGGADAAGGDADSAEVTPDETAPSPNADVEREDRAQADARSGVVSNDELSAAARDVPESTDGKQDTERPDSPDAAPPPDADGTVVEPSSEDRPDLEELREELNDQFESIKIVSPGKYELNLMELYDRDEYIISLQEDGRYVIEVPDSWADEE